MAEKVSSEETVECRIQKALAFKAEGNRCYKDKCFREAIGKYHRALLQVKDLDADALALVQPYGGKMFKLSQEQTDLVHSIQTDCYNNLSACLLQMEEVNYERVKEYSLKVLQMQPENAKALYRAGVAFHHLGDYDQALHFLTKAAKKQPSDANVKKYLQQTESKLGSYYQREKKMYKGMFG